MTTTNHTPGAQLATQDTSPGGLVKRYQRSFTSLLPTHMRADGDQWIAGVEALLRSRPEIAEAAGNDPGAFLGSLVQAARRGLEPGTEEFYLVPFSPKKGSPRIIQGIVGYQGIVELIYRAGAVSSVIVEVVKSKDKFVYRPGRDERPDHEIDWFADDRGTLVLAYAYAVMKDGATSKVVVLTKQDIERIKKSSASAASPYSPWNTSPDGMWLKSAARQLGKWVPTSAEYRRQQLRDAQAVMDERHRNSGIAQAVSAAGLPPIPVGDGEYVDQVTGEVLLGAPDDDELDAVDAVIVDDPEPQPPAAPVAVPKLGGGVAGEAPAHTGGDTPPPAEPVDDDAEPVDGRPRRILTRQSAMIRQECARLGIQADPAEKVHYLSAIAARPISATADLTRQEADQVIDLLVSMPTRQALEAWASGQDQIG